MDYKIRLIRYLYYFSLTGLLVIYLFPGSLLGYFFYGDLGRQPYLIPNPFGTSINHFIAFFYLFTIGLISYLRDIKFTKVVIFLFALSIILELGHFLIPHRSFQLLDLLGNLFGCVVSYIIILFYKKWRKDG